MVLRPQKILVHACCAACASYVVPQLVKNGFVPICFFDHPEISDEDEYDQRLANLRQYCAESKLELIEATFNSSEFDNLVQPYKDKESIKYITDRDRYRRRRCQICNMTAIQKTIEMAIKNKIKYFTTTLLTSPYKDYDQIVEIANEKALDYGLAFYYQDFRKGYWMGRNYARNHDIYIPRFCGCIDSVKEKRLE